MACLMAISGEWVNHHQPDQGMFRESDNDKSAIMTSLWSLDSGNMISYGSNMDQTVGIVLSMLDELDDLVLCFNEIDLVGRDILDFLYESGFLTDEQRMEGLL